jgi:hypothetical protein
VSPPAGRIDRRDFLLVGGLTITTVAMLGASPDGTRAATSRTPRPRRDITMLRTAASLEALAADVYGEIMRSGLTNAVAISHAIRLSRDHHRDHAALLRSVTRESGGRPFDEANPIVLDAFRPRLDALATTPEVAQLAYELENVLGQTYQSFVGQFADTSLNQTAMAVGGVEASHAVLFAATLDAASVPNALQHT